MPTEAARRDIRLRPDRRAAARPEQESTPFTVTIVKTEQDLWKAAYVRHSAYGRHIPELASTLKTPEAQDYEEGTVVLIATSKLDESPLGTIRIQVNRYSKLCLEQSVELPAWLQGKRLAEATRLGVAEGRMGRLVKTMLFKAFYQYCLRENVDWMVIAGRKPLDRQYETLLFLDVFPDGDLKIMHHAGGIPHRVMAFEIETAETRWSEANHPLLNYMCGTYHPDINLDDRGIAFRKRAVST